MSDKIKLALIMLILIFSCTYFFTNSSLTASKSNPSTSDATLEKNATVKSDGKVLAAEQEEKTPVKPDSQNTPEADETAQAKVEGQIAEETESEATLANLDLSTTQTGEETLWDEKLVQQLSFLRSPIPGAGISTRDSQLPGALRAYRNGTHEGLDYYNGYCDVPVFFGDPVYAAGAGVVTRVDHNYSELPTAEREEMLRLSAAAGDTPEHILDKLRGRQVWIVHTFGIVTRYCHLDTVSDKIQVGDWIEAGKLVGTVGNSGTSNGARGTQKDAHLHFEIWIEDRYLGEGLSQEEVRLLWQQVLM